MKDFINTIKSKLKEENELVANMSMDEKKKMAMDMVMGATTMPSSGKMKMISNMDRSKMGQFAEKVETGASKAMGELGLDAQRITEGLGGKATMTNKAMKNFFDSVIKRMDDEGIKPVQEPFIKKINLK